MFSGPKRLAKLACPILIILCYCPQSINGLSFIFYINELPSRVGNFTAVFMWIHHGGSHLKLTFWPFDVLSARLITPFFFW